VTSESDRRVLDVLVIDPREPLPFVVALVERSGAAVQVVQVAHEHLDAGMETAIVIE